MSLSRREFFQTACAAAVATAASPVLQSNSTPRALLPVVIASGNGLRGVERAYELLLESNADPLDAAIAGVNIQELDPEDQSVGLGGLPNEEGVVQLDASCMHGPTRRAGAVAALEGIATPSLVAKAVMDYTDHVMLVGEGAKRFALQMGFREQDLLTEESRREWLKWKTRLNPNDNWLESDVDPAKSTTGTINMCAIDAKGDVGSVTTTSGLSWKLPGRIGDSPIVGAGQYCDNEVGAAGATGRGEAAIKTCGSFLIVELMRHGMEPREACLEALRRAARMTEARLLDDKGRPRFGLDFYAVAKDGRYGSATMYGPTEAQRSRGDGMFAVADGRGARLEPMAYLFSSSDR